MEGDNYIEFLRYCLDETLPLPESAGKLDWMHLMQWAEQQAVVGVIYGGIQRAGKALNIPFGDLMEWIGYAQQIEAQNRLVNRRCVELAAELKAEGFDCCILKGQGNALLYPNPLLRTPGDIDIWCLPLSPPFPDKASLPVAFPKSEGSNVRKIIKYVRSKNPGAKACYHHVDYGDFEGVEVEVHYRPAFLNDLVKNRRLQKWFLSRAGRTDVAELPNGAGQMKVPSWEFNVVFMMCHLYTHLLKEGVGMKQVVDYYYLLKSTERSVQNTGSSVLGAERSAQNTESCAQDAGGSARRPEGEGRLVSVLERLGLTEIAGAVMWVLKEVLGLEERFLIAPVDERRGRFLLGEILQGGNFGLYEGGDSPGDAGRRSAVARNLLRLQRDARLVRYFPSECLWEPVFRLWHFFWRAAM